jgi:hypothetical protein
MGRRGARATDRPTVPDVAVSEDRRPWQSCNVDALAGEELRAYAKRIGIQRRDCEGLTEDRLRQNCKLFIANYFEMVAGD